MAIKPETVAAVKKLVALADKIDKAKKSIDDDFGEVKTDLPSSIKAKQRSMIELNLKTLEALINETTDALADADKAIEALEVVEDDEEFLTEKGRREPVKKAGQRVNDAKDALAKTFTEAKRLQNVGEKGLALAANAEEDKPIELARVDRAIKAHLKEAKDLFQKSEVVFAKAKKAADERNQKTLTAAMDEMQALPLEEAGASQKSFVATLDRMDKEAAASTLAPDVVSDLKDGISDLRGVLKNAETFVDKMLHNKDQMLFLEIAEVDIKQTLKALALDNKFESKLKKAIDGPASSRVKALDLIAKEAKLETDGRKMEAILIKRKAVIG